VQLKAVQPFVANGFIASGQFRCCPAMNCFAFKNLSFKKLFRVGFAPAAFFSEFSGAPLW
jgi:hypothetical protein